MLHAQWTTKLTSGHRAVQSVTNKRQFSVLQTKGSSVCYKLKAVQCVTNKRQFSVLQTKGSSVCYKQKAVQSVTNKRQFSLLQTKGSSVCFDSLLFYKRFLLYAIPSGLDRCCTSNFTLIESCLTMFITTTDMAPWPFSINHSLSLCLCLSLIPWRSVFEYCVQVFPCVHTLEDGAQVAHPIMFQDNQVFLFFYCLNCHDSKKSKLGGLRGA